MRATEVEALKEFKIKVAFEDGVSGTIDLSDLVQKGIFRQLLDETVFEKVYIDGDAIAWSEELEIDAENIYAELSNTSPSELLHKPMSYAAD